MPHVSLWIQGFKNIVLLLREDVFQLTLPYVVGETCFISVFVTQAYKLFGPECVAVKPEEEARF